MPIRPIHLAPALLMLCLSAQAQLFKDNALDALYAAGKYADLDRQGSQRLAARSDDAQGVLALAVGALQLEDAGRRKKAIAHAETCVERQPQAAVCHYALGTVLGVQAMSEGLMKMAGSASRVRSSLVEALTLDPGWYAARSAVVEFYLLAPGVMGGSVAKARETAQAAGKPEYTRALEARLALHEKKYDRALQLLAEARSGTDSALVGDVLGWIEGAAFGLLSEGKADLARPHFERAVQDRPDDATPLYGLARVHAEGNRHAEALTLLERCARMKGAARLPLDYRAGISQQALGQNDAARASFKRFLAADKGSSDARADARKRLEQLGG